MVSNDFGLVLLATLTIFGQILIVGLLLLLIFKKFSFPKKILQFVNKYAIGIAFLISFVAVSGSLFFSEIMKYDPCKLCWYQRILMYPQVILLGTALIKKKTSVIRTFIIPLCVIGAIISLYHYGMQINTTIASTSVTCSITSPESCAQSPFFYYGYITIPLMALTGFILNIILMLI